MKSFIETDIRLDTLEQLLADLAKAIGPTCEVILHDLRKLESSVIAVSGDVTRRKVGAPMTDLGLRILRKGDLEHNFINYSSTSADSKRLRSSTLIIRDSKGKPIAFVCLNFDISNLIILRKVIDASFPAGLLKDEETLQKSSEETFPSDVQDILQSTVSDVIRKIDKPIRIMNKQEKLRIIELLDEAGIFGIKKAHFHVASALNTSRYTIYNYLNEVRHRNLATQR